MCRIFLCWILDLNQTANHRLIYTFLLKKDAMKLILLKYFVQWCSCLVFLAPGTMLSLTISTSCWNAWNAVDFIAGWQFSCLCGQHWLEDHLRGFEGDLSKCTKVSRISGWFCGLISGLGICAPRNTCSLQERWQRPPGDHGVPNLKNLERPFGFWIDSWTHGFNFRNPLRQRQAEIFTDGTGRSKGVGLVYFESPQDSMHSIHLVT